MPTDASVEVPGSTSNLGSGFDCVGFAVDLWLTASVTIGGADGGVTVSRGGTLTTLDVAPEEDLLHAGLRAACEHAGHPLPERIAYRVTSEIPVARGLGSSAAAFVAGARLASDALGLGLTPLQCADLCAAAEGHPDNAAPAALGGVQLGIRTGRAGYRYAGLQVHPSLAFVFAIPDFEVTTAAARAVLPAELPYAVAVSAAARGAALIQGLASGDRQLLACALDDVIHTPFRRQLMPGFDAVAAAAVRAGAYGTTLSGSGSTLMSMCARGASAEVAGAMVEAWRAVGMRATALIQDRPVEAARMRYSAVESGRITD